MDGISWVARDFANSRLDSQDALPTVLCVFPRFFTYTIKAHIIHEIVRRLLERKP